MLITNANNLKVLFRIIYYETADYQLIFHFENTESVKSSVYSVYMAPSSLINLYCSITIFD